MNKKFSRIFSLALVLMLCIAMAIPAFADDPLPGADGTITITKNLIMDNGVPTPRASFQFELTTDNEITEEYPDFKGIMEGVKIGETEYDTETDSGNLTYIAIFNKGAAATPGKPGDTAATGYQYESDTFVIDFNGVDFQKPGVYHYVLTETAIENSPFSIGSANPQHIDVYVEYATVNGEESDELTIQTIIVHNGGSDGTEATEDSKTGGEFNNNYETVDLKGQKKVTGNQGDRTQHFTFKVTVTNPTAPDGVTYPEEYDIVFDGLNGCTTGNHSNAKITAGQELDIELKDGEYFEIKGLPKGATYTITEVAADGYTTTATVNGEDHANDDATGGNFKVEDTEGLEADLTTVLVENNRGGSVPTGILLTIAPFAALTVIGVAGALFVVLRKRSSVQ